MKRCIRHVERRGGHGRAESGNSADNWKTWKTDSEGVIKRC
jgi:hypothetical protein